MDCEERSRRGSKSDTAQVRWVMVAETQGSIQTRQYAAAFVTRCTLSLNNGEVGLGCVSVALLKCSAPRMPEL